MPRPSPHTPRWQWASIKSRAGPARRQHRTVPRLPEPVPSARGRQFFRFRSAGIPAQFPPPPREGSARLRSTTRSHPFAGFKISVFFVRRCAAGIWNAGFPGICMPGNLPCGAVRSADAVRFCCGVPQAPCLLPVRKTWDASAASGGSMLHRKNAQRLRCAFCLSAPSALVHGVVQIGNLPSDSVMKAFSFASNDSSAVMGTAGAAARAPPLVKPGRWALPALRCAAPRPP